MGRRPCCDKSKVKRGSWSPEEDAILKNYIQNYGTGGNWIALPHKAGLKRCGKSCRLRWLNYLRPDIKLGGFTQDEESSQLPGRTDNDVKNYWNTKLKKKLMASTSTDMETAAAATSQIIAPYPPESVVNEPIIHSDGNHVNLPFCPPHLEQVSSPFSVGRMMDDEYEYPWEIFTGIWSQDDHVVDAADHFFTTFHLHSNF
ncbi:hypothetical protein C2S51_038685 [Perilla frutescens var. frutescens]|nr:hypothetical protein C2S51_038685 [Perilla frutescens var. frutescens]